jgi:hypothetical protein
LLALLHETLLHQSPGHSTANNADTPSENASAATSWDAIEISFLSDNRVQIVCSGKSIETLNYAEFGFADRRSKKPNSAWVTLRLLSVMKGVIPSGLDGPQFAKQRHGSQSIVQLSQTKGGKWPIIEKRVQEIRKAFRAYFKIGGDPIPFVAGTGYEARFKISRAPSFDT